MYSYLLYKIIYVIYLDVGTHLGAPGTLKIGPNCPNFKFLVFGRSRIKFSGCVHISYMKLPVWCFWVKERIWGSQVLSKFAQLVKISFFVFGHRSFKLSWSATIMRFRKVLILLTYTRAPWSEIETSFQIIKYLYNVVRSSSAHTIDDRPSCGFEISKIYAP